MQIDFFFLLFKVMKTDTKKKYPKYTQTSYV